jgi:hypothetical protein
MRKDHVTDRQRRILVLESEKCRQYIEGECDVVRLKIDSISLHYFINDTSSR